MKWFRTNIKHGSRLALMALVVQFVLTFGHVHAIEARAADATMAITSSAVSNPAPASTDTGHDSNPATDICPICAVMVLANAVLLATPPVLLVPQAVEMLYLATDAEFVHLNSARVAFQPRAPPVS